MFKNKSNSEIHEMANFVDQYIQNTLPNDKVFNSFYKLSLANGTKTGNHVFKTVYEKSIAHQLNRNDELILSIIYMIYQTTYDENRSAAEKLVKVLQISYPKTKEHLSDYTLVEMSNLLS